MLASSRDVAEEFEKRHDHVLADIDHLIETAGRSNLSGLFIENQVFHDKARKEVRHFDMDRDGCALLAMGFTGSKALHFKLAYIASRASGAEFNRTEGNRGPLGFGTGCAIMSQGGPFPAYYDGYVSINIHLVAAHAPAPLPKAAEAGSRAFCHTWHACGGRSINGVTRSPPIESQL
ncbi:phage regulatory protein, rha family [Kaistia soli DSM 19436]|uniref:Phage regulatory protein, rha family n=1 Tax=Kaistia soli DSM 19436 TaxID=1122133 RepID=A0A1M5IX08_9HYPH|nr:Rha family transcriptional regulator [Kaistia soli]SHG32854.1 phage regulatory protein, rha family [Kaistia soli DSM 19436]